MTEQFINEMYILAVKSKLQRGVLSTDQKLAFILEELNAGPISTSNQATYYEVPSHPQTQQTVNTSIPVDERRDDRRVEVREASFNSMQETGPKKYGPCPDDDGFNNMDLDSSEDGQCYEIILTNIPDMAFFAILTNTSVSNEVKLSPDMAPDYAVEFENAPTGGAGSLSVVKKGVLKRAGRYWKIVEPCRAKWI